MSSGPELKEAIMARQPNRHTGMKSCGTGLSTSCYALLESRNIVQFIDDARHCPYIHIASGHVDDVTRRVENCAPASKQLSGLTA
jgi:hypothetical protein